MNNSEDGYWMVKMVKMVKMMDREDCGWLRW